MGDDHRVKSIIMFFVKVLMPTTLAYKRVLSGSINTGAHRFAYTQQHTSASPPIRFETEAHTTQDRLHQRHPILPFRAGLHRNESDEEQGSQRHV